MARSFVGPRACARSLNPSAGIPLRITCKRATQPSRLLGGLGSSRLHISTSRFRAPAGLQRGLSSCRSSFARGPLHPPLAVRGRLWQPRCALRNCGLPPRRPSTPAVAQHAPALRAGRRAPPLPSGAAHPVAALAGASASPRVGNFAFASLPTNEDASAHATSEGSCCSAPSAASLCSYHSS